MPHPIIDAGTKIHTQKIPSTVSNQLGKLGLSLEQLQVNPGWSEAKLRVARGLRQRTTMSLRGIARQLGMGSWKYLSDPNCSYQ
jgi:hypothetical protein